MMRFPKVLLLNAKKSTPSIPDATPVAFWKLDELVGATIAIDSIGDNDASILGTFTNVTGPKQNTIAMKGDGSTITALVNNGSALFANHPISLELWVNLAGGLHDHAMLAGIRNDSDADFYVVNLMNTNTLECRFRNSAGAEFTITKTISADVWHHVVLVYNNGLTLYIDGVLDTTLAANGQITKINSPFYMLGNQYFNWTASAVASVRVYQEAISDSIIAYHYANEH